MSTPQIVPVFMPPSAIKIASKPVFLVRPSTDWFHIEPSSIATSTFSGTWFTLIKDKLFCRYLARQIFVRLSVHDILANLPTMRSVRGMSIKHGFSPTYPITHTRFSLGKRRYNWMLLNTGNFRWPNAIEFVQIKYTYYFSSIRKFKTNLSWRSYWIVHDSLS